MFSREIEIDFLVCCKTVSLILTLVLGIKANLFWCFGRPYLLFFFFFFKLTFFLGNQSTKQEKNYNYFTSSYVPNTYWRVWNYDHWRVRRTIIQVKDYLVHTWVGDENERESTTSFIVPLKLAESTPVEGTHKCQQVSIYAITAPDWLQEQ